MTVSDLTLLYRNSGSHPWRAFTGRLEGPAIEERTRAKKLVGTALARLDDGAPLPIVCYSRRKRTLLLAVPADALVRVVACKDIAGSWFVPLPPDHVRVGISRGVPRGTRAGYRRFTALNPGPWFNSVTPY
jgi:hypothetical protein